MMGDDQATESAPRAKLLLERIENAAKLVGAVAVLVAAIGFFVPPVGILVNIVTAWRLGVVGYVYYEVSKTDKVIKMKDGSEKTLYGNYLTEDGQLWLLKDGRRDDYNSIRIGDRLQAESSVWFRKDKSSRSRIIFRLSPGDCVIVLRANTPSPVTIARSGGWLKVATTACGLFG